jgi:hypothetical protein
MDHERVRLEELLVRAELDLTQAQEHAARHPRVTAALERLRWAEQRVRHARWELSVLIRKPKDSTASSGLASRNVVTQDPLSPPLKW